MVGFSRLYSAIHKAAGLTVPSRSMALPGTIPGNIFSHEWGWQLEWSLRSFETGERLAGSFVNSAVSPQ